MQNPSPQYHVGIDLGTTHTAVAYAKIGNPQDIQLFQIEQLTAPGQVEAKPLLPSARYHPAENELSEAELVFSQSGTRAVIGEAARLLGAKSKGRLVASAKSWLSHPTVDHHAKILPWGSDESIEKVSPIDASASYLRHICTVWGIRNPSAPLENQDIVITVPASFDEAARSLTLEAANRAGLHSVRLLEEPQAVCYDWLRRNSGNIHDALENIQLLLICDVGGGTTDLTLIKVEKQGQTDPKLTRIAVGDHILLGGDNIDLALAHLVESRLQSGQSRLSTADFSQLNEQCRTTKEHLLAENAPGQVTITLLGGGSKLIGGSRSAILTQDDVKRIALDGFFPLTQLDDTPDRKRSGVVEFGLPYAAEPAISKHIAAFLNLHKQAALEALQGTGTVPDAILLNGGLFRSQTITQRILDLCNAWSPKPLVLLENDYPDISVAYGAVGYAIARHDKKLKIGGGAARSYFLLIDTNVSAQAPITKSPTKYGVCVLPKGSAEGKEIILHDRRFALRTGTPVRFDLVSYSGDQPFKPGGITEISDDFHALPPLVVVFDTETAHQDTETVVQLGVTQTDLGTLKIQCIAVNDAANQETATHQTIGDNPQQRWDVEFQIRKQDTIRTPVNTELPPQFNAAIELIQAVFGTKSKQINPNAVKSLRSDLERLLGDRSLWDSSLLRALFAVLWEGHKYRRRSEHHERVWLSLIGFCLRPGFGCPLDDWRIQHLWQLYPQGIQFINSNQNWSEWWTLWRRIAGGLDVVTQERVFADIANYINPAASRQPNIAKQAKQRSYDDMVMLAAVLERLPIAKKIGLGEWLIKRLGKANESQQTWWAVGRVGARIPFYGNSHDVIPTATIEKWLDLLLVQDWKKNRQAAFAAMLLSRKSGDRVRDIDEPLSMKIIDKLKISKTPYAWLEMVEHYKKLDEKDEAQFYGEALPPGLKLIHTNSAY
ncbi:putative chaperone heat-shock protein [Methyloglobulus morosus KoM1]|uniref:Putative chaperone heat-shock protein n=1 Tax=Methyloglobulus morosus KoM1 TaxID=1116472 RepID=V5CAR1_9GAMM|nr:Hsp70 family protein [Methyloglobulus morosus]ESS73903.1 putative chaperone heat-shock protein [Methyloglobulus morosus KoM1]